MNLRKSFIQGLHSEHPVNTTGRALLLYKTPRRQPLPTRLRFAHANEVEVQSWIQALNSLGYIVDLLDRAAPTTPIQDCYSLVLGLGVGGSARLYDEIRALTPQAVHGALCTVPFPSAANRSREDHFRRFEARHSQLKSRQRLLETHGISRRLESSHTVFCFGPPSSWSHETYASMQLAPISYGGCGIPLRSPVHVRPARNPLVFLAVLGQGLIAKGVDLLVDAFLQNPKLTLHICGPNTDKDFQEQLLPQIKQSSNIHYHGFVRMNSRKMHRLVSEATFQIQASPSEGTSTSVLALLSQGLIPVVTEETFRLPGCGISLGKSDEQVLTRVTETLTRIENLSSSETSSMQADTLLASQEFSTQQLHQNMRTALYRSGMISS